MSLSVKNASWVTQEPRPGSDFLMFRGDMFSFTLSLSQKEEGRAWLRTNIGNASAIREEIIREVDHETPRLGRAWFDIPMVRVDDWNFRVTLPLCEVGHFESKCFFLKNGTNVPVWPQGGNVKINVSSSGVCCANIIYNTFVRQFGPNKIKAQPLSESTKNCITSMDQAGWSVIPPSGRFRDLIAELDFIIEKLGCRFLQLLPIHPTPTTYARMGRFGSPYAALSFTAVDPSLAQFDPAATPLEQFVELVDAVHARNAGIILDIAINHTGWAASLHGSHPHWLVRDQKGRIEVPGAWGVSWADLTRLDYSHKDLWKYMAEVFLIWCQRGVDGFRCDAGYMIPVQAWQYITSLVREQFPDTIFFLEGLGGKISVTRDILDSAGFDWTYSELFQNYDRKEIETYLPEAIEISRGQGITVHFAETHDNQRLAAKSIQWARMRTALCALFSVNGGFAFAGGVEWYATEKINVHEAVSLNWGSAENQVDLIRRLNALLRVHPAFHDQVALTLLHQKGSRQVALYRHHPATNKKLIVMANLDEAEPCEICWDPVLVNLDYSEPVDLISASNVNCFESNGFMGCRLEPAQVICLSEDKKDLDLVENALTDGGTLPDRIKQQMLRAKVLEIFCFYNGIRDLGDLDPDLESKKLAKNPAAYFRGLNTVTEELGVVVWKYPVDLRREVMIPPGHFLMICADRSFRVSIGNPEKRISVEKSLMADDGSFFAIFSPRTTPESFLSCKLNISIFNRKGCEHKEAPLLFLPKGEKNYVQTVYSRHELLSHELLFLGTNGIGGMMRANIFWEQLRSRYDALLAANLNLEIPEDRWIMLTRCRMWVVFQGYSQEICSDCLDSFRFGYHSSAAWQYRIPTGQGEHVRIDIRMEMVKGDNKIVLTFFRHLSGGHHRVLADEKPVRLIIRPDIEDRNFHESTKAFKGPEYSWPSVVKPAADGFTFSPHPDRVLGMRVLTGNFVWEPEWKYMVNRILDKERGHDPDSDLFSPGYFYFDLGGGESRNLTAQVSSQSEIKKSALEDNGEDMGLDSCEFLNPAEALSASLDYFLVKRKELKSVIAGYPWFLDWGRDSLIFSRGLIAAGKIREAQAVLEQFGRFEEQGTLPNMIHGENAGNRDTSDAPFWFFVACSDLARLDHTHSFFDRQCGTRTFRQVLLSIGNSVISGTPNKIRMDAESGLVFSPSHFTWMDTNHPAGTPREGFPIEIQALWYHSLLVLSRIDTRRGKKWEEIAGRVKHSISDLFFLKNEGYLSDCLYCKPETPARQAEPDDSLRPNQLFAVTFDAIDDGNISRKVVEACQELIIPGAIRSLADRAVKRPLEIIDNGILLNDPCHPYKGKYTGDENSSRKPAYHNGTAWTWIFPSFCEAWVKVFGRESVDTALAWLGSSMRLINKGCVGHVPEVLDGDYPHMQRGCDAQAWGASELLRVWKLLSSEEYGNKEQGGYYEYQKTVSEKQTKV
ncbi:MAG: amylo-alpha-1,6-glucosidase [Desulfobacterales bacterium]